MNKAEFLAALAAQLRDLSREDIARSLEYYSEIIDEQVEDGIPVEEAVASLGSPEAIGQEILDALPQERRALEGDLAGGVSNLAENIKKAVSSWVKEGPWTGGTDTHIHVEGAGDQRDEGAYSPFKGSRRDSYEYHISEAFEAVDIQTGVSDVRILRSAGEEALVVSRHDRDFTETVEVRDGVLTVLQPLKGNLSGGHTKFFGINFSFGNSEGGTVTVYLPDRLWKNLRVASLSGDIEIMDIRSEEVRLISTSGDIEARHILVPGSLIMETKSGDISARDLQAARMQLDSMSGDIEIVSGEAESLSAGSKSGDIEAENVMVSGDLRAETASGDVELHRSDARQMELYSASGDIQATLLTPKVFSVHSSIGDVRVPDSVPGAGECRVRNSSGDIDIRLAP